MILKLADRSTTRPAIIAEDVFVKVGKFHFQTDFVVVDYVVDPQVPLILERPFLRTGRALIDVYGEELTLRLDDEAVTFKVGQTLRYFYNDAESINRTDVIDVTCEEYAQEVLGFLEISTSGNPTSEPIISTSSPTLTPFGDSDFLLEETDAFLAIEDDLISPEIDDSYYDSEGDIRLLEEFLNDDPSSPLPPQELRFVEPKTEKSSIDDPPGLELKDLPSHLEYAFLEGTDKLPVEFYNGALIKVEYYNGALNKVEFYNEALKKVEYYNGALNMIMPPRKAPRTRTTPATTTNTTSVTNAQLQAMIDQGVTAVLAVRDANRNDDDIHTSGTGVRRTERMARECTYQDFMKCQPLYFKGTEGVVELTQWIVGHDVAYAMTWTERKKKMTDKYYPRNEMKNLESELWNLKVKGTDVIGYNQRFQELALLYVRMFPEESDKVE
ncbi:reverse transcriptase domain-containing protein, partial [Tanacetum coccineum]